MWKKTTSALKGQQLGDVHTRIMKRNYEQVPEWWFVSILLLMIVVSLITCEGFGKQLQLPWWGVLMSLVIALVFTLPIGVIQATTNTVTSNIVQVEKSFLHAKCNNALLVLYGFQKVVFFLFCSKSDST